MSAEEITRLITDLVSAWNAHDLDRSATFYAPEYKGVDVGQAHPLCGPEGARSGMACYFDAFPDLHFTPEEIIVQDDRAVLAWIGRGTHRGKLMNIPATGRSVEIRGVSLLTIKDNQVQRGLYIWDVAGLLRTLGLLPEL